jgi:transcriptional regulator
MYNPTHFAEADPATLHALMRAHPLGAWVMHDGQQLVANHVPWLLNAEAGVLQGHVARANPAWRLCAEGAPCLVIFQAEQSYITPSWYPSKREHGKVVPTWNYAVVHAHGRARAIDDAAWVHANVQALTSQHEARETKPWQVSDAPTDYIEQMLKAIVGIEIVIERLEGKWKVSQNRAQADKAGVAAGLQARGDNAMAIQVSKHLR